VRRGRWTLPGSLVLAVGCSTPAAPAAPAAPATDSTPAASPDPSSAPSPVRTWALPAGVLPGPPPDPGPAVLDVATIRRTVDVLARDIGVRSPGTDADRATQDAIAGAWRAAGWVVTRQVVPLPQGGETANLIGTLGPPALVLGTDHVVLGGHMDTVAGSPGGNDNASGIAVLTALAERLAVQRPAVPVVLVAFGAEEFQPSVPREHHVGSRAYVPVHAGRAIAMVSADMLGNGERLCLCTVAGTDDATARRLADVAERIGIGDRVDVRAIGRVSDHAAFADAGVPGVLVWSGRDPDYHSPRDTAENAVDDDMARAGGLLLAFVRSLDRGDVPTLREAVPGAAVSP
jgi:aminopeptidase YwaD